MKTVGYRECLEAILEKTAHVNGGLKALDMDIVEKALQEREALISSLGSSPSLSSDNECQRLARQIQLLDTENRTLLSGAMAQCSEDMSETRRRIMELETGKKAAEQYQNPAGIARGAVFDLKS